jgi:hypothetical protein
VNIDVSPSYASSNADGSRACIEIHPGSRPQIIDTQIDGGRDTADLHRHGGVGGDVDESGYDAAVVVVGVGRPTKPCVKV